LGASAYECVIIFVTWQSDWAFIICSGSIKKTFSYFSEEISAHLCFLLSTDQYFEFCESNLVHLWCSSQTFL